MNALQTTLTLSLLAPFAFAQGGDFLFTTTLPEQTISGSGGPLQFLAPNEIAVAQRCPHLAEKWAPRTCFHTMAGDEDNDNAYWEANLFGKIDALLTTFLTPGNARVNQRTVYYSPSQPMGTTISGGPGLRPGDVGRIVRLTTGDGKVEYFIRAEQIQTALGLPPSPAFVNVDAIAAAPGFGVFFSLEDDIPAVPLCSGTTLLRDGDVLMIAASDIVWNTDGSVASVNPACANVIHTEAQMDAFVTNANVTDRNGTCQAQILDTDALEIDWNGAIAGTVVLCSGVTAPYPHLIFAAETLTGGGVLTTNGGGQIYNNGCMPLATSCGSGPTFGPQIGLRPTSFTQGMPSSLNGFAHARVCRFVSETPTPQIPWGNTVNIDFASPGPVTWVFFAFAPSGPGVVAPSLPFVWGSACFPDFYPVPNYMGSIPTGTGFGTYTSPTVPWPCDLVWMGLTFAGGGFEISTPTTVEVF